MLQVTSYTEVTFHLEGSWLDDFVVLLSSKLTFNCLFFLYLHTYLFFAHFPRLHFFLYFFFYLPELETLFDTFMTTFLLCTKHSVSVVHCSRCWQCKLSLRKGKRCKTQEDSSFRNWPSFVERI